MQITRVKREKYLRTLTFIAVAFGFLWAAVYPFISPWRSWDFDQFLLAGTGQDFTNFYYAPWTLPFFRFLSFFPYNFSRSLAYVISAAGWLLALHTFKGNKGLFFISYPFLFAMYYGQVDGIFAGSLALMYLALNGGSRRIQAAQTVTRLHIALATLAWFFASGKFYVGIPLGLGIWWMYGGNWRIRAQIIAGMALLGLLSLMVYPNWLPDLIQRVQAVPPKTEYSIALWQFLGPVILLLWIPVLLSRRQDYRWWVAAWALTVPYLHMHGLTHLLVVPVGAIGWLVQVNFVLPAILGTGLVEAVYLMVIPAVVYLTAWGSDSAWASRLRSYWAASRGTAQPSPKP